jgi:chromosome segregation ATPase
MKPSTDDSVLGKLGRINTGIANLKRDLTRERSSAEAKTQENDRLKTALDAAERISKAATEGTCSDEMTAQIGQLKSDNDSLRAILGENYTAIQTLNGRDALLSAEVIQIRQELDAANRNVQHLSTDNKALNDGNTDLMVEIRQLREQVQSLMAVLQSKDEKTSSIAEDTGPAAAFTGYTQQQVNDQIQRIQRDLTDQRGRADACATLLQKAQQEIRTLTEQYNAAKTAAEEGTRQLQVQLQSQADEVRTAQEGAGEALESRNAKLDALEAQMRAAAPAAGVSSVECNERLAALQTALSKATTEKDAALQAVHDKEAAVESSRQAFTTSQTLLRDATNANAELQAQITALNARVTSAESVAATGRDCETEMVSVKAAILELTEKVRGKIAELGGGAAPSRHGGRRAHMGGRSDDASAVLGGIHVSAGGCRAAYGGAKARSGGGLGASSGDDSDCGDDSDSASETDESHSGGSDCGSVNGSSDSGGVNDDGSDCDGSDSGSSTSIVDFQHFL